MLRRKLVWWISHDDGQRAEEETNMIDDLMAWWLIEWQRVTIELCKEILQIINHQIAKCSLRNGGNHSHLYSNKKQ